METPTPGWGDIVSRIIVSASLIVCAIPALFFMIVSEAESRIVIGTMKAYIAERCAMLRPWIASDASSEKIMNYKFDENADMDRMEHNRYLRLLAFQSTILVLAILLSAGMAIWLYFGRQSLGKLMARTTFYVAVFCITELIFVNIITRMPLVEKHSVDMALIDKMIAIGESCGSQMH